MATFEELVLKIGEGPEAIGDVESFTAELRAEHEKILGVHQTKIGALEADLAKAAETEKELKLTNYDLITGKGVTGGANTPEPEAPKAQGIDALFKVKE